MADERPEFAVTLEDRENQGRYVGKVTGIDAEGEITFTHRGVNLISADHTGAPAELRGTGLAAAMVDYLVADARSRGFQIIPICPFIRARYEKHPEWRDAFTVGPGAKPKLSVTQMRRA